MHHLRLLQGVPRPKSPSIHPCLFSPWNSGLDEQILIVAVLCAALDALPITHDCTRVELKRAGSSKNHSTDQTCVCAYVCRHVANHVQAAPGEGLHPKFCSSYHLFFLGLRLLIFALCPCPPPRRSQSPFLQPQTSPPQASLVMAWYLPHAHPSTPLLFGIRAGRMCLALPSPRHEYAVNMSCKACISSLLSWVLVRNCGVQRKVWIWYGSAQGKLKPQAGFRAAL